MIISLSGHRPPRLGGYHLQSNLSEFAIVQLSKLKPSKIITGMAQGWDIAGATAAIRLDIPFIAAVPFIGQERSWPNREQKIYRDILAKASEVVIVSNGGYSLQAMQARNVWMVNNSTILLALLDGTNTGGTYNCVQYAKDRHKEVINLWPLWLEWKMK
jgi:uncharacterized phage-like protein YoqJ